MFLKDIVLSKFKEFDIEMKTKSFMFELSNFTSSIITVVGAFEKSRLNKFFSNS
jgi:hypothetical protein